MRATVRLAPGAGILARRGDALLYLPERDERLVEAFTTGPDGGELQAVASATVAAGFEVAAYAAVGWGPTVRVMAFGAVAVETDQPSLPMLTGAGSRTWVEHSLTVDTTAVISVGDGEVAVDPSTDLAAGVVLAGGFRLELAATAAPLDPPAEIEEVEPAQLEPAEPVADPEVDPTTSVSRTAPPTSPPTPSPEPSPEPAVAGDDPAAALAAIQAAAMGADGRPVHETSLDVGSPAPAPATAPDDDDEPEPLDADITLPPPAPGELLDEVMRIGAAAGERAPERGSLVDAKLCPDGHPNPPVVASCAVCGQFLSPGASAVVHVPRPSLGHLEFDDGSIAELDHELLVGRNPDRESHPERAGLRPVKVLGDKVSRSHLEIRFQGWDVLVADCGSTNGTFVVPHPGGQVTALQAGRAQLLEPGATVYFGSRSFTVVGRDGT